MDPLAPTVWSDRTERSLRRFLATETGSAGLLLAAAIVALVWANTGFSDAYTDLWTTRLSIHLGGVGGIDLDLRHWVVDGLMALFFYVIGLEIRREWSMGELRDRRAAALPALAALAGMVVPALLYVAINAGGPGAHGWGIPMATDIAFVLGALALLGPRVPAGVRIFLLTLAIVDDIGAIAVIAVFYTDDLSVAWLAAAGAIVVAIAVLRRVGDWRGPTYAAAGVILWFAVLKSGIHPTIAGVVLGLMTAVHPPRRADLARAAAVGRVFRRAPSAGRARATALQVNRAVSANERFQEVLHPWTSYAIVPLFALAEAGVDLRGGVIGHAVGSSITLGIVVALVVGKLGGISLASLAAVRLGVGTLPTGVTVRHLIGASALAGIGFTVSLFVAELSFHDHQLTDEAKVGVLAASVIAGALGMALLAAAPAGGGDAAEAGDAAAGGADALVPPVDPHSDHLRGPGDAPRELVLFGGIADPPTRAAMREVAALLAADPASWRFVFRDLPIEDVHPDGPLAAEAAEAAGAQGRYWEMLDRLLAADRLDPTALTAAAGAVGLDLVRFDEDLAHRVQAPAVAADVDSARRSGVGETPALFVDGTRYRDPIAALRRGGVGR